jgi:hypothetical protein
MYLVDSDVFIQAKNLHYGFDFVPAFWDWLDAKHADGIVASVEAVRAELTGGQDDLASWANERRGMFLAPDEEVILALQRAGRWAEANYAEPGPTTFLRAADSYLVAHAAAHDHVVVTAEQPANSPVKIKIPNACSGLGVRCVTVYAMLRAEGARFVL